jgi:hypothetical protein
MHRMASLALEKSFSPGSGDWTQGLVHARQALNPSLKILPPLKVFLSTWLPYRFFLHSLRGWLTKRPLLPGFTFRWKGQVWCNLSTGEAEAGGSQVWVQPDYTALTQKNIWIYGKHSAIQDFFISKCTGFHSNSCFLLYLY